MLRLVLKVLNLRANPPLIRQPHQVHAYNHVHQPQPHTLVYHIPPLQPLHQTFVRLVLSLALPFIPSHLLLHDLALTQLHPTLIQSLLTLPCMTLHPPPLRIPLQHNQLPNLYHLIRPEARLNNLSRLLQTRLHTIHHHGPALRRMFVKVSMPVFRRDVLLQDVRVDLDHVRLVTADRSEVAAFFPSLWVCQESRWEEGCCRRRSEENHTTGANRALQQTVILAMTRRQNLDFRMREPDLIARAVLRDMLGIWRPLRVFLMWRIQSRE
ncbi:hypothetical protein HBI04_187200 [Parastagonospora nodorum]|nr:hypothetical protein HBI04_187200 [Parastagonospora nodorum]KAH4270426.1 hypothetical protein HBI03_044930 [Parastagonospora nodorum]KAH4610410.1 hypothetical protein HBH82_051910 [Parastagonospora nodorum]KAH4763613.1 hypothetical protein HBH63_189910 [Parastagonospora nodorum]KAH5334482.1 hypothetical protein HBI50_042630 [Parastagonospora nodorum]